MSAELFEVAQEPIPTMTVLRMDKTRGRMPDSIFEIEEIDPDRRLTLVRSARIIGSALVPDAMNEEAVMQELQISDEDLKKVEPTYLRTGLFIDILDPRYRSDSTDQLCWATGKVPFELPRTKELNLYRTGVVIPADEYLVIGRSFRKLAEVVRVKTRDSKANKSNPDPVDARRKIGSSAAKVTHQKMVKITTLRDELKNEDSSLRAVYKESRSTWSAHYTSSKIDVMRREADENFHELIDVATINFNPGTYTVRAMHRSLNKKLNKTSDPKEMALNWRVMASLAGQYNHARQIKTAQALTVCRAQYEKHRQFIKPEERAVFDRFAPV